jgi:hypothetical protein
MVARIWFCRLGTDPFKHKSLVHDCESQAFLNTSGFTTRRLSCLITNYILGSYIQSKLYTWIIHPIKTIYLDHTSNQNYILGSYIISLYGHSEYTVGGIYNNDTLYTSNSLTQPCAVNFQQMPLTGKRPHGSVPPYFQSFSMFLLNFKPTC